jgi:hypothetical protein
MKSYIGNTYWMYTVKDERRILASGKYRTQVDLECTCWNIRTMFTNNISSSNLHSCICTTHRPEDNIDKEYNQLKIISIYRKQCATRNQQEVRAKCICSCWVEKDIRYDRVVQGGTKSCWCLEAKRTTLEMNKKRPYRIRNSMMTSCYKEGSKNYERRWAKGIKVQDSRRYFSSRREENKQYYSEYTYFTRKNPFKDFTTDNCVRHVAYNVSRFNLYDL